MNTCCLPPDWEEHLDESSGAFFYYNRVTQQTQWEKPVSTSLPPIAVHPQHDPVSRAHFPKSSDTPNAQDDCFLQQQAVPSSESKRTMVKIKSKRLSVMKKQSKVYATDSGTHEAVFSSDNKDNIPKGEQFNNKSKNNKNNAIKDMPVGGKSHDYIALAMTYKMQRPFMDRWHNIKCVLCHSTVPEDIFFPCEHKVVCRRCIVSEQVCAEHDISKYPHGHCNCPLCAAIIKLILPNEYGKEVEKYWQWVLAVKPELPQGFMSDFRHSAAIIQKIHIDENNRQRKKRNSKAGKCLKCCMIS